MAKLVLSMDGLVLKEIALSKERITIGRKPHNDVQIDNLAVSGEHAVVVTILNDSFLEDLGSTNGTLVNGMPIKKHFLQNNDVVELGKYRLKYVGDSAEALERPQEFEKTMVIRPPSRTEAAVPADVTTFGGGQTPPAGLVDTSQSPALGTKSMPSTIITQPLAQALTIVVTQPVANTGTAARSSRSSASSRDRASNAPGARSSMPEPAALSRPMPEEQGSLSRPFQEPRPAPQAAGRSPAAASLGLGPPADATGPVSIFGPESIQPLPMQRPSTAQPATRGGDASAAATAAVRKPTLAAIQILTGSNAGRELDLVKPLTTLGRPQVQVAVITRRQQGYFITHVEGQQPTTVNGKSIEAQAQPLHDHDIIELAGVKMEFYFKE